MVCFLLHPAVVTGSLPAGIHPVFSKCIIMATVTRTLKLPFLRLNRVKAEELARLQARNTGVADAILAMPKEVP